MSVGMSGLIMKGGYYNPLEIETNPAIIDLEDDLNPQPRDRCNTWPLQRPNGDLSHNTSPLIHEEIPEEGSIHDSTTLLSTVQESEEDGKSSGLAASVTGLRDSGLGDETGILEGSVNGKKNTARRNAWGNMSYADLITQAIMNSPEKRLTLSQIYDWMVQNVPYFRDKGDSNSSAGWKDSDERAGAKKKKSLPNSEPAAKKPNPWGDESYAELIARAISSAANQRMKLSEIYSWFVDNNPYFAERKDVEAAAGWKNSIRHNLSLHSRFMRIQNEGAGKSSWWVINPDAKPGKASRRRAQTMDNGKGGVNALKEKKKRVRAKVEALRRGGDPGVLSPAISESSDSFYDPIGAPFGSGPLSDFRDRSGSNLSNYSINSNPTGPRLSPQLEEFEEAWPQPHKPHPLIPDILDMAQHMRLETDRKPYLSGIPSHILPSSLPPPPYTAPRFGNGSASPCRNGSPVKLEPVQLPGCSFGGSPVRKSEPPAYTELYPPVSSQANPLLRDLAKGAFPWNAPGHCGPQAWSGGAFPHCQGSPFPGALPSHQTPPGLPSDISDVLPYRPPDPDLSCDVDAVLRYEINHSDGKPLDFNMDTYQN